MGMGTSSVDSSISARLSTSNDSLDGSSNHSSEPITQDQLIKEAITRRKRKSQTTASSKRDDSPAARRDVDAAARDTTSKPTVPILAVITNITTNADTAAQSPQQQEQQKPKTTTTTNPSLLRWMQENSLNLQTWSREEEDAEDTLHIVPVAKAVTASTE